MNPVLIFLVVLGTILLWFLCAFIFRPLGSFVIALMTQALNAMKKEKDTYTYTYINPNSENNSNSKNKEKEKYE